MSEGRKRLSDEVQLANDAKQWVEAIQEYAKPVSYTHLDVYKRQVVVDCPRYLSKRAKKKEEHTE